MLGTARGHAPQSVLQNQPAAKRKKYRDEPAADKTSPANMMWDPRVHRGKTHGVPVKPSATAAFDRSHTRILKASDVDASKTQPASNNKLETYMEQFRKIHRDRKVDFPSVSILHDRVQSMKTSVTRTPVPLHMFLEERPEPTPCNEEFSQTDEFVALPPEAPYVPPKMGIDAGTQIETSNVFRFDDEVEPLMDVLVGKTIEQALMEVRQEEQLHSIQVHTNVMQHRLEVEKAERLKLEKLEKVKFEQKEKLLAEARVQAKQEKIVLEKISALQLAKAFTSHVQEKVFNTLTNNSYFCDPIKMQVQSYLPELHESVVVHVELVQSARKMVDDLINAAMTKGLQQTPAAKKQAAVLSKEERKKRMAIQLYIHSAIVGDQPVGPLELIGDATIQHVELKVIEWMQANLASPPRFKRLAFHLKDGQHIEKHVKLYELGVENLASLQMQIEEDEAEDSSDAQSLVSHEINDDADANDM